ncbi:DUF4215 domain-containing protein [Archangium lipolyticum]|uniref:DUF4215 domain-containing protein n=1 Tax=Archangium lipolyticum TaxID=2970465 RepID=UPI00214A8072|nr:DUF4215 domain-containing protein [Archangium lipolyticum]
MKRETLPPVRRAPLLPLALLLLPLAACLTPESVDCPPELVCPSGQRCAARQPACIKDDCGDGVVQAGETCDDGNIEDGDGCSKTCKSDESCGNGVIDLTSEGGVTRREACDDGNTINGDGCSADCLSSEFCGNTIVDKVAGEVCDDGNRANGDGCDADCLSNEQCGNKVVDTAIGEVCDDGNNTTGDGCSADCRSGEQCGNSKLDPGEVCEDNNSDNTDNCVACHPARCGDGFLHKGVESCDPGPAGSSPTCNFNCTTNKCGDGIVNTSAGEQCDDSNAVDTDGCTALCQLALCGDGIVNTSAGEQCDDGNKDNGDGCTDSCQLARCGDGYVNASGEEQCEPGLDANCNHNCKWNQCGDGIANISAGEACDDGNKEECGTCNNDCKRNQDLTSATGRIIGVPADTITDGSKITFNKGLENERVFEFDNNDKKTDGNIRIAIADWQDSDSVAEAIQHAINHQYNENNGFDWRVSGRSWNVVMLEYRAAGRIDEGKNITESVPVGGFFAERLTRGFGYDCPTNTGCKRNEDCNSQKCTIPPGQVKGTCQP